MLNTLKSAVGPFSVSHAGQLPAVTISFNLKPGVSLGQATEAVQRLARAELPATISYSFVGSAQAFASSLQGMGILLLLAVAAILLIRQVGPESIFTLVKTAFGLGFLIR